MPKFQVLVDDNFHFMDESERYTFGIFDSLKEAVHAAQNIVDDYLTSAYSPGMPSSDLLASYKAFGEDPFILSDDAEPIEFSAWTYAESRCKELCTVSEPKATPAKIEPGVENTQEHQLPELISPEYGLHAFCYAVIHKNPLEILDAASSEIWKARRYYQSKTGRRDFRSGSRGQIYCTELQMLVYVLTNGTVPKSASEDFRATIKPLIQQLLNRWEIGSLRTEFRADA